MSPKNEIRLVANLLDTIAKQDPKFLEQCRAVRHLVLTDPARATQEYKSLAHSLLTESDECTLYSEQCSTELSSLLVALGNNDIDSTFVELLTGLRNAFLRAAVQPALDRYLAGDENDSASLYGLYSALLKIDQLITVADYLRRMSGRRS